MKKEEIVIDDIENKIKYFPYFIRRIFLKTYHNQGMVYMDNNNPSRLPSSTVKWLEELTIITTSQKRADKLSWEYFDKKYPEYKNCVQLF